ncbi:cbb3-type cytochrome c oxidase subunit I [Azospirillum rugosum]|uniref:Cytochrome c oxidase subunit 1 n=1 Tax=Azospirillum rugosum TaxID=416170 RepID=A0ABS4SJE6_9PROT|nr:cbb3-type cytochrome c oxidase subunit I [Azospirillum rugosum]MBP2292698.1 cytochrome c oxidase subunit 1 [Azospirillum rugosum]MDQ0526278.1 cytochrome c oxidase subunit 1 [Azospirillum rugosum]
MDTISTNVTPVGAPSRLTARVTALPTPDKALLKLLFGAALLALVLGLAGGFVTALARARALSLFPDDAYRILTLHGVSVFFYWLYLIQAALLLVLAAAENGRGLALRPLAWLGAALMLAGFGFSEWVSTTGTPLLYDGSPELAADDPRSVGFFALGYLLLSGGLVASAASGIATVLQPRLRGEADAFTSIGFALFAWAGFLVVSAIAATNAFLPGVLWALGAGPFPADHGTEWHILFHNLHYLPLMATVLVWYVLTEHLTGVTSIHGARMSKIVFAAYLVFVPPTSLYHMFLEPNLSEGVRVVGSLLSLFVSVPTLAAFAIIVSSLEASARARGATGLFGWMRGLPWDNPAMANMGWAVVNMMVGITFAFVLIQEKLAPMLSDTFFVPGYFHFFAVGVLTQTFLAALMVILPALGGGTLWRPTVLRRMPVLVTVGLLVFGAAGIAAGFMGVPRRVFDVSYGGMAPAAWPVLMALVGVGATVFAVAISVTVYGVVRSLLSRCAPVAVEAPVVDWRAGARGVGAAPAWTGPASVAALVAAMYVFTIVAFQLIQSLPIIAIGGGHGH